MAARSHDGSSVSQEVLDRWAELREGREHRFLTLKCDFAADGGTEVALADCGGAEKEFSDFLVTLPATECRFGLVDVDFEREGALFRCLVLCLWLPHAGRILEMMVAATAWPKLVKELEGIQLTHRAFNSSGMTLERVLEHIEREQAGSPRSVLIKPARPS